MEMKHFSRSKILIMGIQFNGGTPPQIILAFYSFQNEKKKIMISFFMEWLIYFSVSSEQDPNH